MYKELYNQSTTKILIYGAGCSIVTEPTAQASHLWNIMQLSPSSASPKLSERETFPKFFRMYPPETVFNIVKFAMLKYFGWKKVATLHQSVDLFALPIADFHDLASANGIEVISSESFADNPEVQVMNLKKRGARIILGNFYENKARRIFCQAYKEGMYGAKYVWIVNGWYGYEWWRQDDPSHDCTNSQMDTVVAGSFSMDALPVSLAAHPGVSGRTTNQFLEEYEKYVGVNPNFLTGSADAPYAYDGVWTMALLLQEAERRLQKLDPPQSIGNFDYKNHNMSELLFEIMKATDFEGVSGPVRFSATGDRWPSSEVTRIQDGVDVRVGIYNPTVPKDIALSWLEETPIQWEGDKIPVDSIIIKEEYHTISFVLFVSMTILAAIGIILAITFLVFNIKYRERRYIKMSSPKLNNLILIGGILTYAFVIITGLDTGRVSQEMYLWMCQVNAWLLAIGFSLAFGSMFSKTWRVHKIFTTKIKKTIIKDSQLFVMVAILVVIDIIILVLWEVLDPVRIAVTHGPERASHGNSDLVLVPVYVRCFSNWETYWLGSLMCKNGLMLIFGAFLAWETRKVTVPALNDSKYIGISVYNIVILSFVGVPVTIILDNDVNSNYLIISLFIFFAATVTLCLVFVPKVKARNEVHPKNTMLMTQDGESSDPTESDKRIKTLTAKVKSLEASLGKKDAVITDMESRYELQNPAAMSDNVGSTST
ncbi:gamma-aminobutyric acid type B receptor subunit 2-like [Amphiura filiformis]|uniref:gamma-aminobutyric acid type B receptor subunit 2-like n=1 Tax=Amphiura filiformis TaxID=82378 RepID=UPI003B21A3B0